MDDLDRASEHEMAQTQRLINRHQQSSKNTFITSAHNCTLCDEAIPAARRFAVPGCQLCVSCQSLSEQGI
ncbi:TraR/DksA C4-type zinc finger protein [Psychromonas ossibalaenae]|uniref:TraR/DksA C4-type zinc finger protein n=1 Tax=Psychromonas ossibalaenae TaxID=444922 RepID=UPI0003810D1C|nr:TraR/DksA C4-type zinc finger protein [Psychromonas ossibalaenae]